jgi:hypothetical protein
MENREKLKAKLRKKKENRSRAAQSMEIPPETDIMKMMENVNKILKTNPQMVQQISKCVSNVMNNKELMETLSSQIVQQDQTLQSKPGSDDADASPKESIQ